MTTTAMNDTYVNALLADAAYVNDLDLANINSMLAERLTQPLATFITQNFDVLDQEIVESDGFGLVQ